MPSQRLVFLCDISPSPPLKGMKHKKEVDELFRKLALYKRNEAYREAIRLKTRIIMPGVERDIKRGIT